MKLPDRQFVTMRAKPSARPLWLGLFGPSGGGKTFSALRLAKGIQSVLGGKIEVIDTESGRAKHYAEQFEFEHTSFDPPHGSLDYAAAIHHAVVVNKSRVIIIDSLSHEHEGEGGLIEMHDAEVERLSRGDAGKVEQVKMLAWTRPKAARKQLLRQMLSYGTEAVFILCFRADESSKPVKGTDGKTKVIAMGFMPIAGKPFVYEATLCALLMPGANGVPTWNPESIGERMMRKLPEQFKAMFGNSEGQPLSELHGSALAEWANGVTALKSSKSLQDRVAEAEAAVKACNTIVSVEGVRKKSAPLRADLERSGETELLGRLDLAFEGRTNELEAAKEK